MLKSVVDIAVPALVVASTHEQLDLSPDRGEPLLGCQMGRRRLVAGRHPVVAMTRCNGHAARTGCGDREW